MYSEIAQNNREATTRLILFIDSHLLSVLSSVNTGSLSLINEGVLFNHHAEPRPFLQIAQRYFSGQHLPGSPAEVHVCEEARK